jgi:hypothetical protein
LANKPEEGGFYEVFTAPIYPLSETKESLQEERCFQKLRQRYER